MEACAPSSVGKRQETAFKTRRGYKAGRHTLVSSKAQNFDVRSTRYLQNGKRWGNFAAWGGQNFRGPFSSPDNARGTSRSVLRKRNAKFCSEKCVWTVQGRVSNLLRATRELSYLNS